MRQRLQVGFFRHLQTHCFYYLNKDFHLHHNLNNNNHLHLNEFLKCLIFVIFLKFFSLFQLLKLTIYLNNCTSVKDVNSSNV